MLVFSIKKCQSLERGKKKKCWRNVVIFYRTAETRIQTNWFIGVQKGRSKRSSQTIEMKPNQCKSGNPLRKITYIKIIKCTEIISFQYKSKKTDLHKMRLDRARWAGWKNSSYPSYRNPQHSQGRRKYPCGSHAKASKI